MSWAVFREALIVAPPFLDMCLDIYGAWIKQKKSFDWDIILENIAFFAWVKHKNIFNWVIFKENIAFFQKMFF